MPETFFSSGDTFSCCTTLTIVLLIKMSILYESKQEFHIPHSTFNIEFFAPQKTLGGYCGGVPPLPIPNREVKPACADGTAMQCGRVGGCLLLLGSSRSNDFGDLFFVSLFENKNLLLFGCFCNKVYICTVESAYLASVNKKIMC